MKKTKKMTKGFKKALEPFDVILNQIREENEQDMIFAIRTSLKIIAKLKIKYKKLSDSKVKKETLIRENRLEIQAANLFYSLDARELALTILRTIDLLRKFETYSQIKRSSFEFKKDIEDIEKSLNFLLKKIDEFYVNEYLLANLGQLETLEFGTSIHKALNSITKNNAVNFKSEYDAFFNNDYFKAIKSKTEDRKKLAILCSCLNQLCENQKENLKINFLSILSEALIIELNSESKLLKIKEIKTEEKIPPYDIVLELLRSTTWESLSKN